MTASITKLSAGDGYTYLTKQVAAFDDTNLGRQKLADYYAEKGETPGRWVGAGLASLELEDGTGLAPGAVVEEQQMRALFGAGRHPLADLIESRVIAEGGTSKQALRASQLGRVFRDGTSGPFHEALAEAYQEWNRQHGQPLRAAVPDAVRAEIRTRLALKTFQEAHGREPLSRQELDGHLKRELQGVGGRSCAGFDVTFSPVKSVSALWAVAPLEVSEVIARAQDEAVADAMRWLEQHAAYTRRGVRGTRQVETTGLIAAAFVHRDSRAGDPDLHTHVAISNKVMAREDGAWLALDGRMMYQLTVAASERYNSALERILTRELGVEWVARESDSGRREIREIAGVPSELCEAWSQRRALITDRHAELVAQFEAAHGRPPTPTESIGLAQQATLETREAKHEPRSLAEQREAWRGQAVETLGSEGRLEEVVSGVLGRRVEYQVVTEQLVEKTAERVLEVVEAGRATWQFQHLRAEAERQVRTLNIAPDRHAEIVDEVTRRTVEGSQTVGRDPEESVPVPVELRRSTGESMYRRAHSQMYTSARIRAAEQFIHDAALARDGHTIAAGAVSIALLESTVAGVELNGAQAWLVEEFATSGARVQLALAPAGTGKTTAMGVLARAWEYGGGHVVAMAPTHIAVDGLRESMGCEGGTLAALAHALRTDSPLPDWARRIDAGALVVVDEAGMAGTRELAAVIAYSMQRGASVRLIGDHQQLAAVAAGGVLRDLAEAPDIPVVQLDEVMRFTDPVEAAATLDIRAGDPQALGWYADNDRIHTVAEPTAVGAVVAAWQADIDHGSTSIMLAATNDQASQLNALARQYLIEVGRVDDTQTVELRDGGHAGIGDTVVTRTNDRSLQVSATDFVKNRDRWTIREVHGDGSVTVAGERHGRVTRLPAEYVRASVELGYAGTVHAAQGVTVDTTHTLISGTESRQSLYVAVSRGRAQNHMYVSTGAREEAALAMETLEPPTAMEVLEGIVARDGQARSAATSQRLQTDPVAMLATHATAWQDSVLEALAVAAGPEAAARIDEHLEQVIPDAATMRGYPELRAQLLAIQVMGRDPIAAFDAAYSRRDLSDATNPVAVMAWRMAHWQGVDLRTGGPLPSLWQIPAGVQLAPNWTTYLEARREAVVEAADQVRQIAATWVGEPAQAPRWAQPLLTAPPDLLTDIAVYRASLGIPEADLTPLGPVAQFVSERAWQDQLRDRLRALTVRRDWQLPDAVTRDPFYDVVARRLEAAQVAGCQVKRDLAAALGRGPLPVEHPAAALWYRLAVDERYHELEAAQPEWVRVLTNELGADRLALAADGPDWPRLAEALETWPPEQQRGALEAATILLPDRLEADAIGPVLAGILTDLHHVDEQLIDYLHDPYQHAPTDAEHAPTGLEEFGPTSRDRIIALNEQAAKWWGEQYPDSGAARYLAGRLGTDLTDRDDIIVGYAPPGDHLTDHLIQQGATPTELVDAGLARWRRDGHLSDVFAERLVIGLHNPAGELVGFTGRIAPGLEGPKYINTRTTRAFTKGEVLFGLHEHAAQIDAGADVVRTEGVLDALAVTLASNGQAVGVAPLGTALTGRQAEMIAATGAYVWEAVDRDAAGQRAAARDHELLLHEGVVAHHLYLIAPPGQEPVKDPAELVARPGGPEQLRRALSFRDWAPTIAATQVVQLITERADDLDNLDTQQSLVRACAPRIAALPPDQHAHHVELVVATIADHHPQLDQPYLQEVLAAQVREAAVARRLPQPADAHRLPPAEQRLANARAMAQARNILRGLKTPQCPAPARSRQAVPERQRPAPAPEPPRRLEEPETPAPQLTRSRQARLWNQVGRLVDRVDHHVRETRLIRRGRQLVDAPLRPGEALVDRLAARAQIKRELEQLRREAATPKPSRLQQRIDAIRRRGRTRNIARLDRDINALKQQRPTIENLQRLAALQKQRDALTQPSQDRTPTPRRQRERGRER